MLAWRVDGVLLRQQKPSRMALAWWVDGGLAGLASRRGLLGRRAACCRFPAHPRTTERIPVRSAAIAHVPPAFVRSRGCYLALCQVRTAQQNTNLNQGQRLPDLEAIIIGGRQAYSYYTPSQYAATTTKQSGPCGTTQRSQSPTGVLRGQAPEPTFGDFCLATKVTRARGRETLPRQGLPKTTPALGGAEPQR